MARRTYNLLGVKYRKARYAQHIPVPGCLAWLIILIIVVLFMR